MVTGDKDPDYFVHTLLTLLMLSSVLWTPYAIIFDGEEQLFCFLWTKTYMLPDC